MNRGGPRGRPPRRAEHCVGLSVSLCERVPRLVLRVRSDPRSCVPKRLQWVQFIQDNLRESSRARSPCDPAPLHRHVQTSVFACATSGGHFRITSAWHTWRGLVRFRTWRPRRPQ